MIRYLVIAMRTEQFDSEMIEPHRDFLEQLRAQGRLVHTGPFRNAEGGAYLIEAPDLAAARAIAGRDPLHVSGSSVLTVYEWHMR